MKTRQSLVSNSSSSSFITTRPINKVAVEMFKVVVTDSKDIDRDSLEHRKYNKYMEECMGRLKQVVKKPDVLNGDIGICFPCCNGPSYMIKVDDKVYIDTVNNHDWSDIDCLDYVNCEGGDESISSKLSGQEFYYIQSENLLVGSHQSYDDVKGKHCPTCGKREWKVHIKCDGVPYCASHYIPMVDD